MHLWSRCAAAAALVVAAGSAAGLLGAAGATAATPAFVWGPAQNISISSSLGTYPDATAISCPAAGDCVAAGDYYDGALPGFVVEEADGVWGTAQAISGFATFSGGASVTVNSLSCASPGNCAVAGSVFARYPTSSSPFLLRGFVLSEAGGVWGTADVLAPPVSAATLRAGSLLSVSCSAAGDCVAGGYDSTDYGTTEAEVIEEAGGTWGAPTLIPGASAYDQVDSVSCTAPGDCVAGLGSTETGYAAALATESSGTWSVQAVPGLSALASAQRASAVEAVSCPSAGNCTAAGEYSTASTGGAGQLFVAEEQDGTWGQASEPGPGPEYVFGRIPLSCAAPGDCALAAGDIILDEADGTWSTGATPGLDGVDGTVTTVSCASAGNCSAGGEVTQYPYMYAFVVSQTDGTWGTAVQVAGTNSAGDVVAMSCATADSCVASGTAGVSGLVGFLTAEVPVEATATSISLSAPSVSYGHEQVQTVAVAVSAESGTPAGTVTVHSGGSPVCVITLASGQGSCTLTAAQLAAGPVAVTATYSGPAWYAASSTLPVSFQVTRDPTRTALHLSARRITYRHEGSERISVLVTPRYAGYAAGTVTVTAGRSTVCVVRLSKDAGSCRLAVTRLRPGSYHLVARYGSTTDFSGSASGSVRLQVR